MHVYFWLAVFVFCVSLEGMTMGLTSIWFAGGSLVAALASWLNAPLWLQLALFLVVSIALLIFTRPVAVKYFNKKREKTNAEGIIGKEAIVTETIDNHFAKGQIVIAGAEWTARSKDNSIIEEGKVVKIVAIEGVKAIVKEQ